MYRIGEREPQFYPDEVSRTQQPPLPGIYPHRRENIRYMFGDRVFSSSPSTENKSLICGLKGFAVGMIPGVIVAAILGGLGIISVAMPLVGIALAIAALIGIACFLLYPHAATFFKVRPFTTQKIQV